MSSDAVSDLPVHVTATESEQGVVVAATGEVDLLTTPALQQALEQAVAGHPPVLVVDLTGVSFLGSVGLAALVQILPAAEQGTKVRVVATSLAVVRPLTVTGLTDLLPVFATVDQALAS
ncbi:STAS domain-containing protein [Crossiella sp. SN42]|uniref:STAS domain-containing protein n=1 Tax=Crossiella sp. SN42 TaxID=2944808 RepID=UPI00207C578A|nr:STAS domain-containing protein [Crossiella sp. SN42]MCO1575165.1 STAS domain-containing protein [Crossiella sp. SN42]